MDSSSDSALSIRITFSDPKAKKTTIRTLSSLSSLSSLSDLKRQCREIFKRKDEQRWHLSLLTGFPPKPVLGAKGSSDDTTMMSCGISNHSNVIVRFEPIEAVDSNVMGSVLSRGERGISTNVSETKLRKNAMGGGAISEPPNGCSSAEQPNPQIGSPNGSLVDSKALKSASEISSPRRPKRAAAVAASSSFIESDRAMRQLEAKTQIKNDKRRKTSNSVPPAFIKKQKTPPRPKMTGPGRTLSSGNAVPEPVGASISPLHRVQRRKQISRNALSSEDDVATHLLSSLSSGGSGSKMSAQVRKIFRSAVEHSYDESRAHVKVNAVLSGKFCFKAQGNILGGGEGSGVKHDNLHVGTYTVSYSKGVDGRGDYAEDVDILATEPLCAVITAVHSDYPETENDNVGESGSSRSMLKPLYMAQLSPRVFWSLVYHCESTVSGQGVEVALKSLLPKLDWAFLGTGRSRQLSNKAKENLRQKAVKGVLPAENSFEQNEGRTSAALDIVSAVEDAMTKIQDYDRHDARERAARAAVSRKSGSSAMEEERQSKDFWTLVTPQEADLDELRECIAEGSMNAGSSISAKSIDAMCHALLSRNIRNWRELANAGGKNELPNEDTIHRTVSQHYSCTNEEIEMWIEAAQRRSLDEIMLDILDGRDDVYIVLREEVRAGTPKDLVFWQSLPEMLFLEIEKSKVEIRPPITEKDLVRWSRRSRTALATLEWLSWYATPVV